MPLLRHFGEPTDPFAQHETPPQFLEDVTNPVAVCASKMIMFMSAFPDTVLLSKLGGNHTARTLSFDCRAPYETTMGLCLNDLSSMSKFESRIQTIERLKMKITLGDIFNGTDVMRRWITLEQQRGKSFGVLGLSNENPDGSFEQWPAVTALLYPREDEPRHDIWSGRPQDDACQPLTETVNGGREAYYDSLSRAIGRSLAKRVKLQTA